jgi:hypothetical protein
MPKTPRPTRKLSPFFLFPFTLLLTLLLSLPWVNAKEAPKPKPQPWHIDGIVAALDDSYEEVKEYAFGKLAEYKSQDLKSVLKKSDDIARKAAEILKDKKEDDHMGDPRFRGVYFLLATLLPLDDAKQLREKLIQYAADTKDHTVSDTFVQLLRTR